MDSELAVVLADSLVALAQGESIEQILERHPEEAASLRPLLELAQELERMAPVPSPLAMSISRRQMLRRAGKLQDATRFSALIRHPGVRAGVFLFSLLLLAGLLLAPAQTALPGDPLYPLKRAAEKVRLNVSPDRDHLEELFQEERREELLTLVEKRRVAQADCFGTIRSLETSLWQMDGFTIYLDSQSRIDGTPAVGSWASGNCVTRDGQIFADEIKVSAQPWLSTTPAAPDDALPAPGLPPSATPPAATLVLPSPGPTVAVNEVPRQEPAEMTPGGGVEEENGGD